MFPYPLPTTTASTTTRATLKIEPRIVLSIEEVAQELLERGYKPGALCEATGENMYMEFDDYNYEDSYGLRSLYDPVNESLNSVLGKPLMFIRITQISPEFPKSTMVGSFYVNFLCGEQSMWSFSFPTTKSGIDTFCRMFVPANRDAWLNNFANNNDHR